MQQKLSKSRALLEIFDNGFDVRLLIFIFFFECIWESIYSFTV